MPLLNAAQLLERALDKGLSPAEEAVYRKLLGLDYEAKLIPAGRDDEGKALSIAYLKLGERCPEDVTGICPDNVPEASVVIDTVGNDRIPYHQRVTVQWFGKTSAADFEPLQFRFELMAKIDDIHWMGAPQNFRVAFIGQIKDWPKPEAIPGIIAAISGNTAESYVAWLWTDYYTVASVHGEVPASFLFPVICLGNPNVGAIFPKTYINTKALDEATSRVLQRQRSREERLW